MSISEESNQLGRGCHSPKLRGKLAGPSPSVSLCLTNTYGLPFWLTAPLSEARPDPRFFTAVPGHWELSLMLIPSQSRWTQLMSIYFWWRDNHLFSWESQTTNFTLGSWLGLSRNQRTIKIWVRVHSQPHYPLVLRGKLRPCQDDQRLNTVTGINVLTWKLRQEYTLERL